MNNLKKYPLTLLCVAAIWYLSFFTPPKVDIDPEIGIDKLVHSAMYGGLCFLLWWETFRSRLTLDGERIVYRVVRWSHAVWYALVAPIVMGGLIEILQENCTNHRRSGDWWDFGANSLGVVLMFGIAYFIEHRWVKCCPKPMYKWLNLNFRR